MTVLRTYLICEVLYTLLFLISSIIINSCYGIALLGSAIFNSLGIVFLEFGGDVSPKDYNPVMLKLEIITNKFWHGLGVIITLAMIHYSQDIYFQTAGIFFCCFDVLLSDKNVKLYKEY